MASLEELKKRLYKEKENFPERSVEPELSLPARRKNIIWREPVAKNLQKSRWPVFAVSGFLLILIAGAALYFFAGGSFLQVTDVNLEISGPKEIESGGRVTWQVKATNKNNRDLEEAVLIFNFPASAKPVSGEKPKGIFRVRKSLGIVKSGESVSENFDAYVFGGRGSSQEVSAVLEYRPKGTSAVFVSDKNFVFSIVRSPVSVAFEMPSELRIGQTVEFDVRYTSQAETDLKNLFLNLTFPEGFELAFSSISPEQLAKNIWSIGDLRPGQSRLLKVRGVIRGASLESKVFKAAIGDYYRLDGTFSALDETTQSTLVRSPFLETNMLAGGSADHIGVPGEDIPFEVFWRNNLDTEVVNATLEIKVEGDAADLKGIRADEGDFREQTKSLVWTPSTYGKFKNLRAGDSGILRFNLKIKNNLARNSGNIRPAVKLTASFKSGGKIQGFEGVDVSGSSIFNIKVSSRLQIAAKSSYFNTAFVNSGPLPPKVGVETVYTVVWSLANMSNDLDKVEVRSSLPPYMNFKEIISPADADVKFDPSSGNIVWRVGRVPAGIGFLSQALQVAFQVGLIPASNQIGQAPVIINETEASAKDTFTDQTLTSKDGAITTDLPDDPALLTNQKRVVP